MKKTVQVGLVAALLGISASAATTLTVETNNLQRITQWGMVTFNRPDWGTVWDITAHSNAVAAAYSELGATVLRFHIDYNTYDNTKNAREVLRDAILAATDRGMDWYGLPWSPPAFMKTIDSVNGRVDDVSNYLAEGYEDEVAAWMVDLIQWLEGQGVPLPIAIGFQNEPDWDPPSYPGCLYTSEQIQTATVELRTQLDAAGYTNIPVICNDGGNADDRYPDSDPDTGTLNQMGLKPGGAFETNAAYSNAVGMIATHTYDLHSNIYSDNPGYMQEWYDAVVNRGKELWMTEWEPTSAHAFDDWDILAETMVHFNRDVSSMVFNGWIHWHIWTGEPFGFGTNDDGDCIHRIRPGDFMVYSNTVFGTNPTSMAVRVSANTSLVTLSLHLDSENGTQVGELLIPKTTTRDRVFQTLEIPLDPVSGTHDLFIKFSCDEHWRESDFNWFEIAGQSRIEAEEYSSKTTVETWSSMVASCYNFENRAHWLYSNGQAVQRRPLFYIFKKLWNSAPAGEPTFVRRMISSDDALFQGESKAAVVESYRQDLLALVHSNAMTLVAMNRNDSDQTVDLSGLTGTNAVLYRYVEADAWGSDVDMTEVGTFAMSNGSLSGVVLPAKSITIVQTDSGGDLSAGPGIGIGGEYVDPNDGSFVSTLVDPGFEAVGTLGDPPDNETTQAGSLYNQTETSNAVTTLNLGWFSGKTSAINQQGTTNKYVQFTPSAGWDRSDRWWFGQMWRDGALSGPKTISFDIVEDGYNDGDPSRNVIIEVYTVPVPTAENAKLKLVDGSSSFALLGQLVVDVTGGIGTYETDEIDFTASSAVYAMRVKVATDGALPTGTLGLDNLQIGSAAVEPVQISDLGVASVSGGLLQLTVSSSDPARTFPECKTNLTDAAWSRVGHSTNGSAPFIITNLAWSAGSGSNRIVYLPADGPQKFFRFRSE